MTDKELETLHQYWCATNYLSVGQIYLWDNPLLKKPLQKEDIKRVSVGHWGTVPGLNFIYVHLNRAIKKNNCTVLYMAGPGHGAAALNANAYLEGIYTEFYPEITQDEAGLKSFFKQFAFPMGVSGHASPQIPGSIHEGGELGYSLAHAFGAVFNHPNLIVACVIGDGEAETGPLAASWLSPKFLNPVSDGAVLPILHLNGYKISNPTILGRMEDEELKQLFTGYGYQPYFVEGDEPYEMHEKMAEIMDVIFLDIQMIQKKARTSQQAFLPRWPLLLLRTPKGWTCPEEVDGKKVEDFWRSHRLPISDMKKADHILILEKWLKSYAPEKLFDKAGQLRDELREWIPEKKYCMSANAYANGLHCRADLVLPATEAHAVKITQRGKLEKEAPDVLAKYLRHVITLNRDYHHFRVFCPDEATSNRLNALFNVTDKIWQEKKLPEDEDLSPRGEVMEILSEHVCQGWLEGYLLTGGHGLFACYEAFALINASMFSQYAKWLWQAMQVKWRKPIASLNYLLTSHVWRQETNGITHQDPGFIDHAINAPGDIVRIYFPPDANTLLSITDHCLKTQNKINIIVSGKHAEPQWLSCEEALTHCKNGMGIWTWASHCHPNDEPDVIMACCGDVMTIETLAAAELLHDYLPNIKIRIINIVDLMKLRPTDEYPQGLSEEEFNHYFPPDKPVIFAFHGYPGLIHRLIYRRMNHAPFYVMGYQGKGATTTPFDMLVLNKCDRFNIVINVIHQVLCNDKIAQEVVLHMQEKLVAHSNYIQAYGEDMAEIREEKCYGKRQQGEIHEQAKATSGTY